MCRTLLLLLPAFLATGLLSAQGATSDVLLLKKGNRTIDRFYAGRHIHFYTPERMEVFGYIDSIRRDSLFLSHYFVRRVALPDGSVRLDTGNRYTMLFSLANVGHFPIGRQRGRNLLTDGTLLLWGGAGFTALNLFNTLRDGDPPFGRDNRPVLLTALGVVALGKALQLAWPDYRTIGRGGHRLQVLSAATAPNR